MRESGENYLETILMLRNRNGTVRSIDIASELGYTKASISRAMSRLREDGYLSMEKGGEILLTPLGQQAAEDVYKRHRYLTAFLSDALGIDSDAAARDACRIEHVISPEAFAAVEAYVAARPQIAIDGYQDALEQTLHD